MTYKVYIQAQNNFPIADWAVSAYMEFRAKQSDIYFFEDINEVPISKYVILVASIENTNIYLKELGLSPKLALNIPSELYKYAGRYIQYMTVGEFKNKHISNDMFPIFVKPNKYSKEFIGGVAESK